MATVILKKGEGRTIKAGGAWIYDNEINEIKGDYENGDLVHVEDLTDTRWGRLHQHPLQDPVRMIHGVRIPSSMMLSLRCACAMRGSTASPQSTPPAVV